MRVQENDDPTSATCVQGSRAKSKVKSQTSACPGRERGCRLAASSMRLDAYGRVEKDPMTLFRLMSTVSAAVAALLHGAAPAVGDFIGIDGLGATPGVIETTWGFWEGADQGNWDNGTLHLLGSESVYGDALFPNTPFVVTVSTAGTLSGGEMVIDYSAFDPAFYDLHDIWIDLGETAVAESVEITDGAMIAEIIDGLIHLSGDGGEIYEAPKIHLVWTAVVPAPSALGLLVISTMRRRRRR